MSSNISPETSTKMTRSEIRATSSLASIFALRMLGLFLILPVFSVHAKSLPGGNNATLVGLALSMYGLTQSFGQIPFGATSKKNKHKKKKKKKKQKNTKNTKKTTTTANIY